jgi:hypothetical protein
MPMPMMATRYQLVCCGVTAGFQGENDASRPTSTFAAGAIQSAQGWEPGRSRALGGLRRRRLTGLDCPSGFRDYAQRGSPPFVPVWFRSRVTGTSGLDFSKVDVDTSGSCD